MTLTLPEGGRIIGLGSDIIEVDRIRGVAERQKERFFDRIFTAEEQHYCNGMKNPWPHYAARFAAKEAISKAFTTGIGGHFEWKTASVYHGERHQPLVRLAPEGENLLRQVGADGILLSLSHTKTYAEAVAVLYRK